MKKLSAALLLYLGLASAALAQQVVPPADTINCAFNTVIPTVSTGQMARVQCDSGGRFILSPAAVTAPSTVQISDGTTGPVAVKPASTAAVATDKALVVQMTPNSPGVIALGQTTKAASVPVTIATDQYVDPCQSPNIAKSSVPINITTATTTSLVAVSGSTVVYVCGVSITVSEVITTPNTILFEYGTGATCTSPTALTGKYGDGGVTAGIPIVINASNGGTIFKSAAAAGICALTTIGATASFQGVMTYVQQ